MLSDQAREKLQPMLLILRIIVLALGMGIVFFGVFAAVQNVGKPQSFGGNVQVLFLAASAPLILAGFIVPLLLPKAVKMPEDAGDSADAAAARGVFVALQTRTIIGCSMFEGAAFTNLVSYYQNAELVHLAVAGVCLICILAHFLFTGRVVQRIEEQLQRERDQRQFG